LIDELPSPAHVAGADVLSEQGYDCLMAACKMSSIHILRSTMKFRHFAGEQVSDIDPEMARGLCQRASRVMSSGLGGSGDAVVDHWRHLAGEHHVQAARNASHLQSLHPRFVHIRQNAEPAFPRLAEHHGVPSGYVYVLQLLAQTNAIASPRSASSMGVSPEA